MNDLIVTMHTAIALTEIEAFQWAIGVMLTLFTMACGAFIWVIWRLQQIPEIKQRQDDQSTKVQEMSLFLVRVDNKVEFLKEDFNDMKVDLRDTRNDVKEILSFCQRGKRRLVDDDDRVNIK